MRYLIKNGSIIDPAQRVATVGNVLVENGCVARVIDHAELGGDLEIPADTEIINARGAVIAPGFLDLSTHLRQPGHEHLETLVTAARAAAVGGFTTICAAPDTTPAPDTAAVVRDLRALAHDASLTRVEVVGALTRGRAGQSLNDLAELAAAGCVAFGDADRSLHPVLLRSALQYAAMLGLPIFAHCEDAALSAGWAMHEGAVSTRLGLPGYAAAAEEILIARDIALAEMTSAHLHIRHVSTAGGVALIRAARQRGAQITADVTAYHLTLTERWVLGARNDIEQPTAARTRRSRRNQPRVEAGLGLPSWLDPRLLPPYHTATRVNPPLRGDDDCEALIEGLRDGTIDAITTDHAPLGEVEKGCEYRLALPGISSLETTLGLALTLVHRGKLDLVDLVAKLTEGPAGVLGRTPATLRAGSRADIVVFDTDSPWIVDPTTFESLGRNTPLIGQRLKGRVMLTMIGGEVVFRRGSFGTGTGPLQQASRLEGILGPV